MVFKDLIRKITGTKTPVDDNKKENNQDKREFFDVDYLGLIIGKEAKYDDTSLKLIDKFFTYQLPQSNILVYELDTLKKLLSFETTNNIFFVTEKETDEIKKLKQQYLNFKSIFVDREPKRFFYNKIKSLLTFDYELTKDEKNFIHNKNIPVQEVAFDTTTNHKSIKQKSIKVDASGWVYNPSTGVWSKYWGWDGEEHIPGWGF